MAAIRQQSYINFKNELEECRKLQTNLLIITLPGTGMTRVMTDYVKEVGSKFARLITGNNQEIGTYNLINLDWAKENTLADVENIFKNSPSGQKNAVAINYPSLLSSDTLMKSFFINHTYRKYYFGLRSQSDTIALVKAINPKLTKAEAVEIYLQSGGLAQLVKYLAVSGLDARDGLTPILTPVVTAVNGVEESVLEKLGIKANHEWVGKLLQDFMKNSNPVSIKVNFDLSFKEDGLPNPQKLTTAENELITKLLNNHNQLTKEEVSDIKWGEGKYDQYSDQAINKQMRRLDDKLQHYTIQTIPKVGFILRRK